MGSRPAGSRDLGRVVDAIDRAAHAQPIAVSIREGEAVVLARSGGLRADGRAFDVDTPVLLYSVGKAAVGLTATLLAARGDLDLDDPVARWWPEFGAAGKEEVTIAQALSHAAAVPGWPDGMTLEGLRDLDVACDLLAGQAPWWPIGEPGEHIYTYGHLVSGVVRGRTGRHLHEVWTDDIAGPLGLGLSFTPPEDAEPVRDVGGVFLAAMRDRARTADPRLWQPLELCDAAVVNALGGGQPLIVPAVLSWAGADAIARMYAFWSGTVAHLPGKPAVWTRSRQPMTTGRDHVMGDERSWGAGMVVEGSIWGMGGIGGCVGWHDERTGLSVGITGPVLDSTGWLDDVEAAIDAL